MHVVLRVAIAITSSTNYVKECGSDYTDNHKGKGNGVWLQGDARV